MPAPRQPTRQTRSRSNVPRPAPRVQPTYDDDVIVISSDDEAPVLPKKRPAPKRSSKQNGKAKAKPPLRIEGDVLELSSEDEGSNRRRSARSVQEMEKQLKKLKEENEQLRRQQAEPSGDKPQGVSNESEEHEAKYKALLNTLDDTLCCDICAGKMWSPATLVCGHTFCKGCLQDWFTTALMKHLGSHPNYTMHTPRIRQLTHAVKHANLSAAQRRILELDACAEFEKHAHPDYTCPTCRVAIRSSPMEVFSLKAAVNIVGKEMGESEPAVQQPAARGNGDGPWDGFFLSF
ncbi:hypothetical protein EUX98_g3780 [Antrodiella citrinella]|uniref:RING-type domain-containing protein n=1 Tax=Antrodiella citrinella TaxID=2447956 RepID=A0A4V3XIT7_9APHY|nr:hypothetical protein EUX98_g3780 [Antrodiella citrinella]